jgi:3-hydroxypropanoate dehydrogenase
MTLTQDTGSAPITLGSLDEAARAVLFTDARTVNTFASTPVSDEQLAEIWDLAKWPPTATNAQPLRVLYVRTPEGKGRLLPHMAEGNRAKTGSAPAVAVLAVDTQFHEHLPTVMPIRPELRDALAANDVARESIYQFNSALQAGYFILAVRAAGLAAGPMAGFDKAGVDAEFFPGGRWRSILVVNLGHPGENPWFPRLPRLDQADVIQWA